MFISLVRCALLLQAVFGQATAAKESSGTTGAQDELWFGERWLYTMATRVIPSSECTLWSPVEDFHQFHCSFLNYTHVELTFMPSKTGNLTSTLRLSGDRELRLRGTGLTNPFKHSGLDSHWNFIGLKSSTAFQPWLYLHNPLARPIRLAEVYTTNPQFPVDVPEGTSWTIPARSTRPVARLSIGKDLLYGKSYLRVRSRQNEVSLFIPLRYMPSDSPRTEGLDYPAKSLQIGPVFVSEPPLTLPLNVVNNSPKSISLQATSDSDGLRLQTPEKPIAPGKTCTVKVTIDPERVSRSNGHLQLKGGKWRLQVPYSLQLLNGSLQAANSKFYIGGKGQRAFSVELTNTLNTSLRIERILMNSAPLAIPAPGRVESSATLKIPLPPMEEQRSADSFAGADGTTKGSNHRYNASLRVLTNITEFEYKLEFYSNRLDLLVDRKVLTEQKSSESSAEVFDAGTQGVRQKKKLFLELYNPNPVEITIEHVASNVSTSHISLPSPPPWTLSPYWGLQLTLTLSAPEEGRTWGVISVKTDFHSQSWPFVFRTSKGTVTAATGLNGGGVAVRSPGIVSVEGAFPFRHSTELIYLESSFDSPLVVADVRVEGNDPRFSIDLVDSPVLHPGAKSLLGTLKYLPSCASPTSCYVGLGGPLEASSSKDLYLWRAMQERLKETRGLNVSLVVDTMNVKGFVIPVTVSHVWPRVTPRGAVRFETTRLGESTEAAVVVDNPSDQPLMMQAYVSTTGGPEVQSIVAAQHAIKMSHLSSAFSLARSVQNSLTVIAPRSKKKIIVRFEPSTIGPHLGVLVVRNNLTAVSSVLLRGEGGLGKLLLAGQEPEGTIVFDLNAALLKDCANIGLYTTLKKYPVAKNVGQLPIRVKTVLINERPCVGYGFRVKECEDFVIKPNASHRIELSFTPDFTVSRVEMVLSLVLDDSTLDFNIVVTLPKNVLASCADQVVRPSWEKALYIACLMLSLLFILCVLCYAFLDANRVLQDTLFGPRCSRQDHPICLNSQQASAWERGLRRSSDAATSPLHRAANGHRLQSNAVGREDVEPSPEPSQPSAAMRILLCGKKMFMDWLNFGSSLDDEELRELGDQRNSVATQTGLEGDSQAAVGNQTTNGGLSHLDRKGSLQKECNGQTGRTTTNSSNRRKDSNAQGGGRRDGGNNRRNKRKDFMESFASIARVMTVTTETGDEAVTQVAADCDSYNEADVEIEKQPLICDSVPDEAEDPAVEVERDRSNTPIEAETETTSEDNSESSTESSAHVKAQTPDMDEVVEETKIEDIKIDQKPNRRERKEKRKKRDTISGSPPPLEAISCARSQTRNNSSKRDDARDNGAHNDSSPTSHLNQTTSNGLSATLPDVCVPAATAQRKPPMHTPSPPAEAIGASSNVSTPPSAGGRDRRRDSRGASGELHARHETGPRYKKQQTGTSFRASLPMPLSPQENRQLAAVASVPRTISYSAVVSGNNQPHSSAMSHNPSGPPISAPPAHQTAPLEMAPHAEGPRRLGANPPPGFPVRPSLAGPFSPSNSKRSTSIGGYSMSSTMPLNGPAPQSLAGDHGVNDEQEMAPLIRSIIDSVIPTERDERLSMSWIASDRSLASPVKAGLNAYRDLRGPPEPVNKEEMANVQIAKGNSLVGGRGSGRSLWGDTTWRSNSLSGGASAMGPPTSPNTQQCTQSPGFSANSANLDGQCFGSGSMGGSMGPSSQTFPTFLRRTPKRERERDRREMGVELHHRQLGVAQNSGPNEAVNAPPQLWSPPAPRHLNIPRNGHQMQQRLVQPPAVSPTNDYSYIGSDIWGSGPSALSPTQPSLFPSPIGTPWTPFRGPALSLSSVRENDATGKKTQ